MASTKGSGGGARAPRETHTLHLVLRDGFRGHRVVITLNDRTVYDGGRVTTRLVTARADALELISHARTARLGVRITPGNLSAAYDVDVAVYPHVAISLVGEATVAFESSASPFR
jgi:hypothetical protein